MWYEWLVAIHLRCHKGQKENEKNKKMLVVRCTFLSSHPFHLLANKRGQRSTTTIASANRKNVSEEAKPKGLNFPLKFVAQSAVVAVFALGFIDAGYSGDWSRIGVISKSDEDLLKYAAFIVVPLCIFILVSFTKKPDED